jgi:hypothetical protein
VQVLEENEPDPPVDHVTVPEGDTPLTLAVHEVDEAAATGEGVQETTVVDDAWPTVKELVPELPELPASPP